MKKYETVFLKRPSIDSEEREKIISEVKDIIINNDGSINEEDNWGKKQLAYDIKNESEAYYYLIEFDGNSKILDDLNEYYNLSEDIIRTIIVRKG